MKIPADNPEKTLTAAQVIARMKKGDPLTLRGGYTSASVFVSDGALVSHATIVKLKKSGRIEYPDESTSLKTPWRLVQENPAEQLYSPHADEKMWINEFIADMEWDEPYSSKKNKGQAKRLRESPFKLVEIPLYLLETAENRELTLSEIPKDMAGQSRTTGPIMLDYDYSVIDGMHRIATAYYGGHKTIKAYISTRKR